MKNRNQKKERATNAKTTMAGTKRAKRSPRKSPKSAKRRKSPVRATARKVPAGLPKLEDLEKRIHAGLYERGKKGSKFISNEKGVNLYYVPSKGPLRYEPLMLNASALIK